MALGLLAALGGARARAEDPLLARPDPAELLAQVRGAFPVQPLRLTAELQARDARGTLRKTLHAEARLERLADAPGAPLQAQYTLRDAFGAPLLEAEFLYRPDAPATGQVTRGKSDPAPPAWSEPIEGTDFTWADLTLAYLWWPAQRTVGFERRKSRPCWIVEVAHAATGEMAQLWLDPETGLILRVEVRRGAGPVLRILEVKRLRRLGEDLWMPGDMEVRTPAQGTKTMLRVRHLALEE